MSAPYRLKPAYTQAVIARGRVLGVPDGLSHAVAEYVARGLLPGFLLRGVLTNDLEALARDGRLETLLAAPIGPLAILVRDIVPEELRGSREAVDCHVANHARWAEAQADIERWRALGRRSA
jgi:hypothetical protein